MPRAEWEARLRAQGSVHPLARMRMLDGFTEGWIAFEHASVKGTMALEQALLELLQRSA